MSSIPDNQSPGSDTRHLFLILFIYFFVCFPLSQVYLKEFNSLYIYWKLYFFITALTFLFMTGRLNFSIMGLSKFHTKDFFWGLSLGLLPAIAVVVLDALIVQTGMAENNLFYGAELRKPESFSNIEIILGGVLNPVISQLFVTGYVLNGLIKNKSMTIPGNGVLYSSINFNLGIGYLGLGMISAGLVRLFGSLIPAIFFSVGCAFAKILILTTYPRITTILVFLV